MEVAVFTCSICGETSRDICVYCTKDACANHLCDRCKCCSDCCQCEVTLLERQEYGFAANGHVHEQNGHVSLAREEDVLVDGEQEELEPKEDMSLREEEHTPEVNEPGPDEHI